MSIEVSRHRQRLGFTLIELAIVLVVIGLVVGGILAGRELINTARMLSVIAQIDRYNVAAATFKAKFDSLPGDMASATKIWPADPQCGGSNTNILPTNTCDGNGDGQIAGYSYTDASVSVSFREAFGFWNQLALANLIGGSYKPQGTGGSVAGAQPKVTIPPLLGGGVELTYTTDGLAGTAPGLVFNRHVFILSSDGYSGWPTYMPMGGTSWHGGRIFTSSQALSIDSKVDDGRPYSGKVSATWDMWTEGCGKSASGLNVYVVSPILSDATRVGCALFFNAQF